MILSQLIFVLVVVFILYFRIYKRKQILNAMRRRVSGLSELSSLRKLLEYIPQHRGMANAFLQGDQSFRSKIDALDKDIDMEISELINNARIKDKWNIYNQIDTVKQNWIFIKKNLSGFEPEESFSLHTALVKNILYLIHDLGNAANILTTQDAMYAKLADAVFIKLPLMTEMMGQARGMGTGVATKGVCNTNMRVKLTYLANNARHIANAVCSEVKMALNSNNELKQQAETVLSNNQHATQYFLDSLENNIINIDHITLSSTDYYAAGTQAIQHAFALMDKIAVSMQSNLQSFIARLSKSIFFEKVIVVFIMIVVVSVTYSFPGFLS